MMKTCIYLCIICFIALPGLSQSPCTPSENEIYIRYDFLNEIEKPPAYKNYRQNVYCLCDSGYAKEYIQTYDKIYFCRYRLSSLTYDDYIIVADFYKINDTIWNAIYYYPEGFIKATGNLSISGNIVDTSDAYHTSPCPPYDVYTSTIQIIQTRKTGSWQVFSNNPFVKFTVENH